jgi:amidase
MSKMLLTWPGNLLAAFFVLAFASSSQACPSIDERNLGSYNATQAVEAQVLESPYPYYFPVLQAGSGSDSGQFPMPLCHGFKLEEATIDQLQDAMEDGKLSSKKLVGCYLQRIYQTDFYIR